MQRTIIFSFILLLLTACATNKPWYSEKDYSPDGAAFSSGEIRHTVYLIGDCGKPQSEPLEGTLQLLKSKLENSTQESSVIFLGDNIYNAGLVAEDNPERQESERRINAQLNVVADHSGEIVFVPGNHDWNNNKEGGWEAIQREEKYIEDFLARGNVLRPDGGCSGPSEIMLANNLVLLAYDSQWWLHEYEKPGKAQGCQATTREDFVQAMDSAIAKHADKTVIVAAHHPFYTNGTHGGRFPAHEHFFPLTAFKRHLYIPLPVLGSVYVFSRMLGVSNQDLGNKNYCSLKENLEALFKKHDNLIYASGHEHSLQYHKHNGVHYVVSGSGSKRSYARKGKGADFVYAQKGFSALHFLNDGEIWVEYFAPVEGGLKGKVVYRKQLK